MYAPGRGGLELIDLKHGKTVRTFIPKVIAFVIRIGIERSSSYGSRYCYVERWPRVYSPL